MVNILMLAIGLVYGMYNLIILNIPTVSLYQILKGLITKLQITLNHFQLYSSFCAFTLRCGVYLVYYFYCTIFPLMPKICSMYST